MEKGHFFFYPISFWKYIYLYLGFYKKKKIFLKSFLLKQNKGLIGERQKPFSLTCRNMLPNCMPICKCSHFETYYQNY